MEQDSSPSEDDHADKIELGRDRDGKADLSGMGMGADTSTMGAINRPLLTTLPAYESAAFWDAIEEPNGYKALPLEVLVRCVRVAIACGDTTARNHIVEVIIRRTQTANEYWARNVLKYIRLSADERAMLAGDLYADLCECLIRALLDPKRVFWEENFQHCLRFERQHVYLAFMRREGRLHAGAYQSMQGESVAGSLDRTQEGVEADVNISVPRRIPRRLIRSMDAPVALEDGETLEVLIEDERAQEALQAIEHEDMPRLVLGLPQKLKSVVWLIFWEGRTEKDTAQVLGITDRTVRNRLREALKLLREGLDKSAPYSVREG